ncbi:Neurotransmitter-gated ion-channel transmembrane region [Candidatus Nitrososphaera evergladensis SR1]|uniref:Neurotransmitter-gated ion-channel transmembrane region n=1 Tax=Candidatus Nitrososphaera evergladensis SR1 TaxID=1459636 RepID=A0A075MRT4_9ARCH|nr:hypothetical protein [Candidatus Nitrososphaera evergladensis]AIF82124.1 Neurotransmitter-gated ion-channel transmembrane region [Candidatus Nitrososphaera evergladensis SR1]
MYKIAATSLSLAALAAAFFSISMSGAATTTNLAFAQEEEKEKPESRTVGVYLVNVGKVDLQAGSYDIDFYIWFSSDDPNANFTKSAPRFDFMNAFNATITPSQVEPGYYEARVEGTFVKNMDFRQYPFDTQRLTVEVEGFEPVEKLVFKPDTASSGFDDLINVPGWTLDGSSSEVINHHYREGTFSRYIFAFAIERAPLSAFLKTIFPVLIITAIAMLAFWMSPAHFAARVSLAASTLLAAVAAHLSAANQLPPIGYLTFMDKIMIIVYALFLNNLLSLVLQMRLVDRGKEQEALRVNARMRRLMPVIIVVILAILVPFV